MAENTTSENALSGTPQGQSQPTSESPQSQPVEQAQERKPVNLYDLPEFREFQSRKDRELRQMRDESSRQMAQMQAQLEALQTKDMPDEQRGMYELQKRDHHIQRLQSEMQAMRAEQARMAALAEISHDTGIPLDLLTDADNPDEAWRRGVRWAKENLSKAQQERVEEQRANAVDLGRGRGQSAAVDLRDEYRQALENNDAAALYGIRVRAQRGGIEL